MCSLALVAWFSTMIAATWPGLVVLNGQGENFIGKPWENHGKTMGKPWENDKTMGKPWENDKTMGK